MIKKVLWVDDIRDPNELFYMNLKECDPNLDFEFVHVHSVNEAIQKLKEDPEISIIDIDHDSGDFFNDGGDFIKVLDYCEENQINDKHWRLHTANPVGRNNMIQIIQKNNWDFSVDLY